MKFKNGDEVEVIAPDTAWTGCRGKIISWTPARPNSSHKLRYQVRMSGMSGRVQPSHWTEDELVFYDVVVRLADLT